MQLLQPTSSDDVQGPFHRSIPNAGRFATQVARIPIQLGLRARGENGSPTLHVCYHCVEIRPVRNRRSRGLGIPKGVVRRLPSSAADFRPPD